LKRINWGRLIFGGIVATIILFLTDGLFHERVMSAEWKAVYDGLGATPPQHHSPVGVLYFAVFDLGRGMLAMYLYALMRSCCGPGPKTAMLAGVVAWLAFTIAGPAQFIPLGFYSNSLWIKVGAFQLFTSIVAALVGGAIYKDAAARSE
jgi:hypothetical protein